MTERIEIPNKRSAFFGYSHLYIEHVILAILSHVKHKYLHYAWVIFNLLTKQTRKWWFFLKVSFT